MHGRVEPPRALLEAERREDALAERALERRPGTAGRGTTASTAGASRTSSASTGRIVAEDLGHLGRLHERLEVVEERRVRRVVPLEALDVAPLELEVALERREEAARSRSFARASIQTWLPSAAARIISVRSSVGTRRCFSQSRRVTRIEAGVVRVVVERLLERAQALEQSPDLVVDELLVRDPAERRERLGAGGVAAGRHRDLLVPARARPSRGRDPRSRRGAPGACEGRRPPRRTLPTAVGSAVRCPDQAIETLFAEDRRYPPPPEFAAQANAQPDIYDIPFEEFWEREGRERVTWFEPFTSLLEWELPYAKWYGGGKINVAYNCLDRHVEAGLGDRVAFYYEGEPVGERAAITYSQLLDEVVRAANGLKALGVGKGTPVGIYMGMGPGLPGRDARVRAARRAAHGRLRRLLGRVARRPAERHALRGPAHAGRELPARDDRPAQAQRRRGARVVPGRAKPSSSASARGATCR